MRTHIRELSWFKSYTKGVPSLSANYGWGNGYVILPKEHPWYGKTYNNIPVEIHGGLTYSNFIEEENIVSLGLEDKDIGMYMIGFDTAHYGDNPITWTKEAVQKEADKLLEQCIIAYNKGIDK